MRLWNATAETITGLAAADVVGRLAPEAIPGWPAFAELVTPAEVPGRIPAGRVVALQVADASSGSPWSASASTRAASSPSVT